MTRRKRISHRPQRRATTMNEIPPGVLGAGRIISGERARVKQELLRKPIFYAIGGESEFIALPRSISAAKEFLERFQISGGAVGIFAGLSGIGVFGGVLRTGEIDLHALLMLDHIAAQPVAS